MRIDSDIIREIHLRWKQALETGLGSISGRNIVLLGRKVVADHGETRPALHIFPGRNDPAQHRLHA